MAAVGGDVAPVEPGNALAATKPGGEELASAILCGHGAVALRQVEVLGATSPMEHAAAPFDPLL